MPDNDETTESAWTEPSRRLFRSRAREPRPDASGARVQQAAAPAKAKKKRWPVPESTKRLLFILAGVFVLAGSVAGFYLTSDAFDQRVPVLVAVREIAEGETLSSADFGSELMITGSVPHIPWTADAPVFFEGTVALQPIPAGGLVRYDMAALLDTVPEGDELVVEVPLDLSLVTEGVFEGDLVLLVDPGLAPTQDDPGRARRVVREFTLENFDGARTRLILPARQWAEWTALLDEVGGTLMVKDLGPGADVAQTARSLDAVWRSQWSEAVEEVAAAAEAAPPEAGPGELEVIVALDTSLVPSGVAEGDLVLLIDPGAEPLGNDEGRPRRVLQTLELENYADGQMQLFVGPEQWHYWLSLPDDLGAKPMVLSVPGGTDVDDMSARLDAVWEQEWRHQIAEAFAPA